MTIKVPLSSQIATITRLRDAWECAAIAGDAVVQADADVLNGVLLTLELLAATEGEYRAFLKARKSG